MDILHKIVEAKKLRVAEIKKFLPLSEIKKRAQVLSTERKFIFSQSVRRLAGEPVKLIAEIKKASPVKGVFREYDIEKMSDTYVSCGVDAISVITEENFFLGSQDFLVRIRKRHPRIPILRKDFIFDAYQIYESRVLQADAVLLIAAILTKQECKTLYELSKSLGMDVLFEIHDDEDLEKALFAGVDIIGINNRNLNTMEVNLETTFRLKEKIPEGKIIVSESGISKKEDVARLMQHGIDAILVGTSIILSDSPEKKIKELKYKSLSGNE